MHLSEEHCRTRLARGRANFEFTPDLSRNTFARYDNLTEAIGINGRVRWIVVPGGELFLVFKQDLRADGGTVTRGRTGPVAKFAWTFRF